MVIDHVGVVVKSMEAGIEHWKAVFGYRQMTEIVISSRQKVKVAFLTKENSLTVKLIEPTDQSSPVYAFSKRGGGLHHLCFKCAKLNEGIERLKNLGLRILGWGTSYIPPVKKNIKFLKYQKL
jgi:methylmalonyl-CoA/ethylmalonyl-CoA epimerase